MEAALGQLGREYEPPPGWEARVLAQVEARRPRRTWWFTLPSLALVALVIALWPGQPPGLELALKTTASGPPMRGGSAHIGDVIAATASGGERYRAIWVYRDDELIAACPGSALCEISGDAVRASVALAAYGSYAFVALSSAQPIPPPRGSYDLDLVTAGDAGAGYKVERRDTR
jgi:hypothetical protein